MCTFGALSGQMGLPQVFLVLRSIPNTLAMSLNLFTDPRQPDHQLAPCSTELHWMHVVSDHKQTIENKEHILAGPTSVASFSINLHLPYNNYTIQISVLIIQCPIYKRRKINTVFMCTKDSKKHLRMQLKTSCKNLEIRSE
jgi:hypothetical protein